MARAKKAIDKDKEMRELLRERTARARQHVRDERTALTHKIAKIRVECEGAPRVLMDRLRARFLEVGKELNASLDPDKELFDPRFTKRASNTAKARCRLDQREARVDAEPGVRAGKLAYAASRHTQEEAQKAAALARRRTQAANARIPKGAQRKEAEEAVVRELAADDTTAELIPIWKKVRADMFKRAAESEGKLSAGEAFIEYVNEHFNEVQAELTRLHEVSDRKLAKEQAARAKAQARASGAPIPSEAFSVPGSRRAPDSGVRPSRRALAGETMHEGPRTVMSARGAH